VTAASIGAGRFGVGTCVGAAAGAACVLAAVGAALGTACELSLVDPALGAACEPTVVGAVQAANPNAVPAKRPEQRSINIGRKRLMRGVATMPGRRGRWRSVRGLPESGYGLAVHPNAR